MPRAVRQRRASQFSERRAAPRIHDAPVIVVITASAGFRTLAINEIDHTVTLLAT